MAPLRNKVQNQVISNILENTESVDVLRITPEVTTTTYSRVVREIPFTIIMNDEELVTLLCSPGDLKYLAVGFLNSEGLVNSKEDIKKIIVDDWTGVVRVVTNRTEEISSDSIFKRIISSGCGRGASFYSTADTVSQVVNTKMSLSPDEIFGLVNKFQHYSELYQATHGVHSAALCDRDNILVFNEDIGRHNAIDKIFGKCLLEDISTDNQVVITTGRITSEILYKVAKRCIPILISISAPTNLGINIADTLGITLVALVRGKKMNIYTGGWRIKSDGKRVGQSDY